jgi:hypothetical protein
MPPKYNDVIPNGVRAVSNPSSLRFATASLSPRQEAP